MLNTYHTPKQTYKQQPSKICQPIHQKSLTCKSLSPQELQIPHHYNHIKDDQDPSTPQKIKLAQGVKLLKIPSQLNDNSFRGSSSKNILTSDSPLITHNKENNSIGRRICTESGAQDNSTSVVIQENKKLNELIQRLFREKQELVAVIEKQKNQPQFQLGQTDQFNLRSLKARIERLEAVIDQQSEEIKEWKLKYKQACEEDERVNAIDQMESQILKVVEENERLNNLGFDKDKHISNLNNEVTSLQKKVYEHDQKIKDQSTLIVAYEEETKELKKIYKTKLTMIERFEQQLQEKTENSFQPFFHENQQGQTNNNYQIILDCIKLIEQQLCDLSTQYTSQVLENQRLFRQNNNLKEELLSQQKALDEIRTSQRGTVNPKFQEVNKNVILLREKITQQMIK
ncbi:unnamed protein product (macronuclear) [Paramecium tetraurelia]|uniref:Uncharacterized protein n=1 Tax=Paramecium tetraurelia TaxID=5888 RepID=A0E0D8_PARTE|nr:uncharacterized protein GSPATT00021923001 [Paramecium tetraurelia]CAK88755.1 unnamed protein product [Paramecium tetraurelia]|eukprot:XP_001456152.1 hypothetical protein (macronuclear) [Paramecium tetraurelia strain d4-2]